MLISQQAECDLHARQGGPAVSLAELRRQLGEPAKVRNGHRQRLLELAGRLARVRALGDEYARVDFSPFASAATKRGPARA